MDIFEAELIAKIGEPRKVGSSRVDRMEGNLCRNMLMPARLGGGACFGRSKIESGRQPSDELLDNQQSNKLFVGDKWMQERWLCEPAKTLKVFVIERMAQMLTPLALWCKLVLLNIRLFQLFLHFSRSGRFAFDCPFLPFPHVVNHFEPRPTGWHAGAIKERFLSAWIPTTPFNPHRKDRKKCGPARTGGWIRG